MFWLFFCVLRGSVQGSHPYFIIFWWGASYSPIKYKNFFLEVGEKVDKGVGFVVELRCEWWKSALRLLCGGVLMLGVVGEKGRIKGCLSEDDILLT